jgi:hypothetical protein
VPSSLAALGCLVVVLVAAAAAQGGGAQRGPIAGIVPPFSKTPHRATATSDCNGPSAPDCGLLLYGGGPVMHTSAVYAIFWLPAGYTSWDGQAPYSTNYQSLIARYFSDLQADSGLLTNVYGPGTQYCDGTIFGARNCNGVDPADRITTDVTYGGSWVDTRAFPANGCTDPFGDAPHCLTDAQLVDEIQHAIDVNGWTASATNMFFVYTPRGVQTCVDSGGPGGICAYNFYCAYHSNVGTGSDALIYANMAYPLFGSEDVCRDSSDVQEPNGDIADAVLSTTSHEHDEAITDPEPVSGWFDAEDFTTGGENGDKCAYYYGQPTGADGSMHNQVINGHEYYLQLEWSNSDHDCVASYFGGSITKLSPTHGVVGQPIQIKGKELTGVSAVTFGFTPAASFSQDGKKLVAVPDVGTATGPVHVSTAMGKVDGPTFTVDPSPAPIIRSFSPKSTSGVKTVTVSGKGLWGASSVEIGGVAAQSFTVKSATKLTFVVAGGAASGTVAVTTPGGTAVSIGTLTIT